nr:DNA repair protein RecO C-terminal domain-containing protein [Acidobacteriota bacterium]
PYFLQKFAYLSELIVNFAPPHDPNEKLYRMAKICLETAALNAENLESLALYFELWILRLGGYLPDWNRCDNCKTEFNSDESGGLQLNFHLLCRRCRKSKMNLEVSASERKVFLTAQRLNPADFVDYSANFPVEVKEISSILKRIISSVLGREIIGERVLLAKF